MSTPFAPVRIRIRTLPASAGLDWIRRGWRAFRRQPGGFLGLFGMVLLATLAFSVPFAVLAALVPPLQRHPVAIQLLGVVLLPLLSLGYMLGTEAVTNDLRVRPHMLFLPLAADRGRGARVVQIGLVYVAVLAVAYLAGNGIDGGEALAWLGTAVTPPDTGELAVVKPLGATASAVLLLKVAIVALGSVPLWHAPALVLWGGQRPVQAMFSSIVALWRTRSAFAVYVIGWAGIFMAVSVLLGVLLLFTQSGFLLVLLAMIVSWTMSAVFYVTLWFGFVDTFEITPMAPPDAGPQAVNPRA